MEINSDTEEYESKKKVRKVTTVANLFKQIQTAKPRPSRDTPVPIENVEVEEDLDSHDESEPERETRIDAGRNSSQLLNSMMHDNLSSGSIRTPPLEPRISVDDPFTQEPDIRQLVLSLHKKVDENTRKVEESKLAGNRTVALLSQINAKLDVFASQVNIKLDTLATHKPQQIEVECIGAMSAPLKPVRNLDELESLEKKSSNEQFVVGIIRYFGSMHGKAKDRYVGEGGTVCLQIVDYFFHREFMLSCSWTGTTRNKSCDEVIVSKIAFHKFDGVIALFHKVVMFSDPSYSLVECQKFLHRCLRNAKQRFEEIKGTRAPVARKRRKRNGHDFALDNEEEKHDEEEDPLVEYDGLDGIDISDNKPIIVEEYLLE
ncbi:uncharacterized protein LOC135703465 [Ochlerotatus camptorhynchus]|uniref:uncharacterized protein LOC135703465 n=1 Tax=Ochlerotatus camptorhynchus TaxID=644619 RepID=UPI0031D45F53